MASRRWVRRVFLLQKICQGWEGCENQHGWGGAGKRLNPRCGWGWYSVTGCSSGMDDCGVTGTGSEVHSWRGSKSKGSCGRKKAPQVHDGAFTAAFLGLSKLSLHQCQRLSVRTVWCSYWQICGRREVGQAACCGYLEMDSSLGTTGRASEWPQKALSASSRRWECGDYGTEDSDPELDWVRCLCLYF